MPEFDGSMRSLPQGYSALVIGATGTIGAAFAAALRADPRCERVDALSRTGSPALVLEDEASIAAAAATLRDRGPYGLIVDATGALSIDGTGPEKRLADVTAEGLARAFAINAIGRAMVLKHFAPLLAPADARSILAALSARVGSIADNRLGGWYGYRASKAAGNMLLQTAAVELARTRPLAVFAALQPGTVRSRLSEPFVAGHPTIDATASVGGLLAALDGLAPRRGAWFVDHRGETVPW
jgi:NAD(P)-dependent dehydrogenase (short-subunit alcohol dehydrogenase family)